MSQTHVLCRYFYYPLDRLASSSPAEQDDSQGGTILLAVDQQQSLLFAEQGGQQQTFRYTPYGFRYPSNTAGLIGFAGQLPDPLTGHYLLGNGHRAFNPPLMRFNSPDRLSPFGDGGLNGYAYCAGDPVNYVDPDGQAGVRVLAALSKLLARGGRPLQVARQGVKHLAAARHPTALASEAVAQPGLLIGTPSNLAEQRISAVKDFFRVPGRRLKPAQRAKFDFMSRQAATLTPVEQRVMSIQSRPLPEIPDGRVFNGPDIRRADALAEPLYDLPRPHLPRKRLAGVSGMMPPRQMPTIYEEARSIRSSSR